MAFRPVRRPAWPPSRATPARAGLATDGHGADQRGRGECQAWLATGSKNGEARRAQNEIAVETTGTMTGYG